MVVGEGSAGKTSSIRSLLGEEFNPNWDSTVGANLRNAMAGDKWVEDNKKIDFTIQAAGALVDLETFKPPKPKGMMGRLGNSVLDKVLSPLKKRRMRKADAVWETAMLQMNDELMLEFLRRLNVEEDDDTEVEGEVLAGDAKLMDTAEVAGKFDFDLVAKAKDTKDTLKFTVGFLSWQEFTHLRFFQLDMGLWWTDCILCPSSLVLDKVWRLFSRVQFT